MFVYHHYHHKVITLNLFQANCFSSLEVPHLIFFIIWGKYSNVRVALLLLIFFPSSPTKIFLSNPPYLNLCPIISVLYSLFLSRISSFVILTTHLIFTILMDHHLSKASSLLPSTSPIVKIFHPYMMFLYLKNILTSCGNLYY